MSYQIGIDPGMSGAVAVLDGAHLISYLLMPVMQEGKRKRVNAAAVAQFLQEFDVGHCFIEKVGAMPGQGVSSMFSFGHSAGIVEGVATALAMPVTLVTPQAWKKSQGLIGTEKDATRTRAIRLYPTCKTLSLKGKGQALADAIFIARHGSGL